MTRVGLIAVKLGMSSLFVPGGRSLPVTLLRVSDCQVVSRRTQERDGYNALVVGYGAAKVQRVSKPLRGMFTAANLEPKLKLREFRVESDNFLEVGSRLVPSHFSLGQFVDVVGLSIGKGFCGPMKRWNFRGLEQTHGVSISHRSHGSTGNRTEPARVFKNKKMAGHYGASRVTVQNLKIVEVDDSNGLLIVMGAVPGANGGYLLVQDAVKKFFVARV